MTGKRKYLLILMNENKINKYPKYKPSGIQWIGEIPEDWKIKKVKHLIRKKIADGPHESPEFLSSGIPFLSVDSIKNGELDFEGCRFISEVDHLRFKKKAFVEVNDILMGKAASIGKIARVKVSFEFNVWSPLAIIKPNRIINNVFFEYYLKSTLSQYQIEILCTTNTQKNISMEDIPKILVILPPLPEQTAIANYLDQKTAQIDELISKKEQLLKLYEEEKTAIINQAVTGKLNCHSEERRDEESPNNTKVKYKDSGIEWLGKIPEHWKVKKFKYYFNLITEKNGSDGKKIGLENIESKTSRLIETDSEFEGEGISFKVDDILFGKLRPYLVKVYLANFEGKAVGDFHVFRSKGEIFPQFGVLRLMDYSFIDITNSSTYGAKMPRVNWDFIANLKISFPSFDEQKSIVNYIEIELTRINSKIKKTKKLIELLKEYRTALISEAVTGKIKVC